MFKKFMLFFIIFFGVSAYASENYLNSVVLENNDGKTNIILRSDSITKVNRDVTASDRVILTLKDIKQSQDMSALYKNVYNVTGFIVENNNKDLKIYIEAPDISSANVVFDVPNNAPVKVNDASNFDGKFVWSIISGLLLLMLIYSAKNIQKDRPQRDINDIIKEREKDLYRTFQKEVATLPSMSYKLKSYRKHVLKGETIRSYESRLSKI